MAKPKPKAAEWEAKVSTAQLSSCHFLPALITGCRWSDLSFWWPKNHYQEFLDSLFIQIPPTEGWKLIGCPAKFESKSTLFYHPMVSFCWCQGPSSDAWRWSDAPWGIPFPQRWSNRNSEVIRSTRETSQNEVFVLMPEVKWHCKISASNSSQGLSKKTADEKGSWMLSVIWNGQDCQFETQVSPGISMRSLRKQGKKISKNLLFFFKKASSYRVDPFENPFQVNYQWC